MHISVLLEEAVNSLALDEDSIIVDATLGYGGHSSKILERIKRGHLFAFDQDGEVIPYSTNRLNAIGTNFTIIKSNFVNMKEKLNELKITKVDGVLFDLGVSSGQLDTDERGFSYHKDAKLDMRMDKEKDFSAYNVVNEYDIGKLTTIFNKYGESKFARNIAKKIVEYRENKRPLLVDLKNTGNLECNSDVVILLYRDYDNKNITEISVSKNRFCSVGITYLEYDKEKSTFIEY